MQQTPVANRLHIALFGRCNTGKSALINALTNQDLAIVSAQPGTTTDPVYKTIEILPEPGPCVLIDTAGLDDPTELAVLRQNKTQQVLLKTDLALVLLDAQIGITEVEETLLAQLSKRQIPVVIVCNKKDLWPAAGAALATKLAPQYPVFQVSAMQRDGVNELRAALKTFAPSKLDDSAVLKNIVRQGDTVLLVIPIDAAMPKGRLILPEVQTIRSALDEDAHVLICKETELASTLASLKVAPDLVVTDSQAFMQVQKIVPAAIRLTSFSLLFARLKGDLPAYFAGAQAIASLRAGERVLMAEACTHHPQKEDIGRVKIPRILEEAAGGKLHFEHVVAADFPADLGQYRLIVMCGCCMITRAQVQERLRQAREQGVPITNYGVLFAHKSGLLARTSWLMDL